MLDLFGADTFQPEDSESTTVLGHSPEEATLPDLRAGQSSAAAQSISTSSSLLTATFADGATRQSTEDHGASQPAAATFSRVQQLNNYYQRHDMSPHAHIRYDKETSIPNSLWFTNVRRELHSTCLDTINAHRRLVLNYDPAGVYSGVGGSREAARDAAAYAALRSLGAA